MRGLGTLVNVAAIIIGSGIGIVFKSRLSERFRAIMVQACGLAVMFIGAAGVFEKILTVSDGEIVSGSTILIVVSLVLGGLCGELIGIEKGLDTMGEGLKGLVKAKGENRFVEGFVTASLVVCVGAMAICGPLRRAYRL